MKEIKLGRGKYVALVDDDDYDFINQWKWHTVKDSNNTYAIRRPYTKGGKKQIVLMHRVIMNTPENMLTDHINHNGLDNRRCNLRHCNSSENSMNSQRSPSSGYKGVEYSYRRGVKYIMARICVDGKRKLLGMFKNEKDAAMAYDIAAVKYFREFACLNFPEKYQDGRYKNQSK